MKELKKHYGCPVEVTVEVIGGKWKCTILWWLRKSAKRFGELMQLIPAITSKVLTQQLRELEGDGVIARQAYPERPPRVEYFLTPLGETLKPITDLMCNWGKDRMPNFKFGLLNLEGLKILAIAEDADLRKQLRVELGTIRGAQVTTVSTARRLPQIQPDAVVIDLGELKENLSPLIGQIQLLSTKSQETIPIISLAAQTETRIQAFSEGLKLILTKPVEPSELVAAIANITGRLG